MNVSNEKEVHLFHLISTESLAKYLIQKLVLFVLSVSVDFLSFQRLYFFLRESLMLLSIRCDVQSQYRLNNKTIAISTAIIVNLENRNRFSMKSKGSLAIHGRLSQHFISMMSTIRFEMWNEWHERISENDLRTDEEIKKKQ